MKNENFEKYMRPNTFYVTFKYEDTLVAALTKLEKVKFCEEEI